MDNTIFNYYIENYKEQNIFIQPFFENNIILEKSNNIYVDKGKNFLLSKKNVYKLTNNYDGYWNYYFSIYKINKYYILFYRFIKNHDKNNHNNSNFAYSLSSNGIEFINQDIIIKNDVHAHNFYPYFFKNKILGLGGTYKYSNGLDLFEYKNNSFKLRKKNIINKKNMLSTEWHPYGNHFDSLNTINYHNKTFYIHARYNTYERPKRQAQLFKTKNLINLSKSKICCYKNKNNKVIKKSFYYPGVIEYKNTIYNLSIPTYFINHCNFYCNSLFYTKKNDQLNFYELNKLYLNKNCSFVNGMVPNSKNTKYLIYVVNNYGNKNLNIDCFSIEKDRFKCISCKELGYFKTKINNNFSVKKIINNFFVNFESFDEGYINIQIVDCNNKIIYKSNNINGNHLNYKIKFNNIIKLNNYKNLYFLFNISNSSIYSYKVIY